MACAAVISSASPTTIGPEPPCRPSLNDVLDALPNFARTSDITRNRDSATPTRKRRRSDNRADAAVADFLAHGAWNLLPEAAPGQLTGDKLRHACTTLGLSPATSSATMTWPDVSALVHEPSATLEGQQASTPPKRQRRALDAAATDDLIRDFLASGAWNDLKYKSSELDKKVSEAAISLGLAPGMASSEAGCGPSTSLAATTWNDVVAMETEKTAIHAVTVSSGTPIEFREKKQPAPTTQKAGGQKVLFEAGEFGSSSSECISGLELLQEKA